MASNQFPVAVIGIGVRLPGAKNCEEFWKLMIDGKDTVDEFPKERAEDIDHVVSSFRGQLVDEEKPFFTGSFFKSVDKFDPDLFQINPREALFIEPEQRFFLEVVWELLEDAGYASKIKGTKTGVYVGNTVNKYKYILNENHPSISHGNHSPFISSRVSYTHDLHGPAMMVATGCSSSLLAVHLACQGLLSGDCDMAIAGGITLDLLPISAKTDIWNQLGITGPHVKCRAFDASAKGIAKGEGCGVVLLKPLHKALDAGDHIYGILEATTANQDGHSNGITAPHPVAQANMLHQAWTLANIKPDALGFFEAHGTGTELGDPIEISGITNAYRMSGVKIPKDEERKIPIGSVKANIGHLADGAAGVVGLIKSLLCLHHNKIPGSINFTQPNPHINWQKAPVVVKTKTTEWPPNSTKPRYASVSAFGLLGTNIHAVVKEYRQKIHVPHNTLEDVKEVQCLCLAANTRHSLEAMTSRLLTFLKKYDCPSQQALKNICYTINVGREQSRFKYRAVMAVNNFEDLVKSTEQLNGILKNENPTCMLQDTAAIAVSLLGQVVCDTTSKAEHMKTAQVRMIQDFINRKNIKWGEIYQDTDTFQKIPQLPTYEFNRVRLWPNVDTPINKELLQLEHKFKGQTNNHSVLTSNEENVSRMPNQRNVAVEDLIRISLTEALNVTYDWRDCGDENLFNLGMDSLIFTQVAVRINSETGVELLMSEFHKNPTFNGICSSVVLQLETINQQEQNSVVSKHSLSREDINTESLLRSALNAALGQEIDWKAHSEENLFNLGVDSLIYTHVNMKLRETTNLETPISMAELHENPTFSSIKSILQAKVNEENGTIIENQRSEKSQLMCEGAYPISFAQRRLWVMQEIVGNPCAYNATNCLKLTGDFHPKAFQQAVNHVISNNATFKTIFEDGSNGPLQRHSSLNTDLVIVDLRKFKEKAEYLAMEQYSTDYKTPFDLLSRPLVRCTLYTLSDDTYYFTMVVHHIIFDGWSHFVFYNELWETYRNIIQGLCLKTPKKKILYADLAVEEFMNSQLSTSKISKDMEYWKGKLAGELPLTTFLGDKKRPQIFTYNGNRITRFIPLEVFQKLNHCSDNQHTTFMNLMSSVFCLIKIYTGSKDLIIGTPVAGRYDAKSRDIIGCFINTLAIRVYLDDNMSFNEVLEEVSKVCLEAYDHQQAPFDHLVSQLNLPRDTSITPVFSINVCYHNTEIRSEHVDPPEGLTVERKLLHNNSSKWDMQFDFLEEPDGMRFTLEYYSDLFSDEYANCIVDNYIALLNSIIQHPREPTEILSLKPNLNIHDSNNQSSVMVGPKCDLGSNTLPTLLLQSLNTHKSSMIIEGNDGVTYDILQKNTQKLASFLRNKCNIPKGARIGILMDNSVKSIESVLACFMSGLVYVPMDVNSPKSRLQHISEEADIKAIIFGKKYISLANHIQWNCPNLETLICINGDNFADLIETEQTPLMDTELWDSVAMQAEDGIEGGGWKSSYTAEHMTEREMSEYSNNIFEKLKPFLTKDSKVLEIGCASGLTTKTIKPHVGHYVATDLSEEMVRELKEAYKDDTTMEFKCVAADKITNHFQERKFDIIIMNSVIHCFPGYNYLKDVIWKCENMLTDDGILFIGDIMDLELKDDLITSVKSFKSSHPTHRTKTDWNNELFIPRRFLQYICATSSSLKVFEHSRKIYSIPNELTEFRYDALLRKSRTRNSQKTRYATYALADIDAAEEYTNLYDFCEEIQFTDEAYILYTSGTSGTPKGVIISQEALLNYVQWAFRTYEFSTNSYMPFFAPLTFDFTITSIFPPILAGSQLYVYNSFQDSYQNIVDNDKLTIGKFSPLQLDMILSYAKSPIPIKKFIIGGEELKCDEINRLKANKGDQSFAVWNEYGPTEATVGCVVKCYKHTELPLTENQLLTIGYPIDNTIVGVVRNTLLVPIGGKGSLAIGGKCLCNGFAGKGDDKAYKTTKAFKTAVWGGPVERMLLTDDVAEVLPKTREMAYFGRKDSGTVKVNGIRVDLKEIQKALEDIIFIKSAWVCSFEYEENTFIGAAVLVKHPFAENETWKQSTLSSLQNSLPLRLIPRALVEVKSPPTNANGKTDMKMLRDLCRFQIQMSSNQSNSNSGESATTCPMVLTVQRIWQSILPINFLPSPNQNFFFDLSGDSLQAIHLVRKMRDEGFRISVTDIFQHPTIEKLLPTLGMVANNDVMQDEDHVPFKPTPILEDYIINKRKYTDHFALSAVIDFHNEVSQDLLKKALRSVMVKHGSLRSKITNDNERVTQEVLPLKPDQPVIFEVSFKSKEEHLSDETEFINTCELLDNSHSLTQGILVGAAIFHIEYPNGERKCYGLLVVHHAAIDIVSWQQILEDLAVAFKFLSINSDKEPVLKPCQLPFRSYCDAVHKESSGIFSKEVDYWSDIQLKSKEAGTLVHNEIQSHFKNAKWYSKAIDASSLRTTSTSLGCSDEQVLLTAFGRAMSVIHGKDSTSLCMESHGRQLDTVDSTDTVGWCTSMYPFILNTPLKDDIIQQVRKVGQDLNSIPNRGLGFGLLKSAGKITMPHPKVTFIFQGSLDASTKETFDGGKYQFDHIPWIEIMLRELQQRRFHRHDDEILEFDLEFIAWIHSGELKFGCLFDEDTVSQNTVEEIVKRAELNLNALSRRVQKKMTSISINIVPGFNITPDCKEIITDALGHHNINAKSVTIQPAETFIQSLYQPSSATITIILPRIQTELQQKEVESALQNYVASCSGTTIVGNLKNLPNTRSISAMDSVDIAIDMTQYEAESDTEHMMPLSKIGYSNLALNLARYIRKHIQKPDYKVVAVDGDYTVWDGECASGVVSLNHGNIAFQNFLLEKKMHGVLLVMVSKNEQKDVDNVFENPPEGMVLQKEDFVYICGNWNKKFQNLIMISEQLNLGLNSFIFIDDNLIECEEMLRHLPEVLTLLYPSEPQLVPPFTETLWMLDTLKTSNEAANRTRLYQDELKRKAKIREDPAKSNNQSLNQILRGWNMEMIFLETNIKDLKGKPLLYSRSNELLHRTNQFKLNDANIDLDSISEDCSVFIVSLKDKHGCYGIISVCVKEGKQDIIQWVVSCRALDRQVEQRIFIELFGKCGKDTLNIHLNRTRRNTPMANMMKSMGVNLIDDAELRKYEVQKPDSINSDLHHVHHTRTPEDIKIPMPIEVNNSKHQSKNVETDDALTLRLQEFIQTKWSSLLFDQSNRHSMFPLVPSCRFLHRHSIDNSTTTEVIRKLWMEVLGSQILPDTKCNFLHEGGNSFAAVFLTTKLRRILRKDIAIVDLLKHPILEDFVEVVELAEKLEENNVSTSTAVALGITAAQQRMIIMQEAAPESTAYVETIVLHVQHSIDPSIVLSKLVKNHPILNTIIDTDPSGKYTETKEERGSQVIEEFLGAGDNFSDYIQQTIPVIPVMSSPLYRFRHVTSGHRHYFVLHVHHIICDEITLSAMSHTLHNILNDAEFKTKIGKDQYYLFKRLEDEYMRSKKFVNDCAFWEERFSTLPHSSQILSEISAWNDTNVYAAAQQVVVIPKKTVIAVSKLCNSIQITEFQYYLAISSMVLQEYLGVSDVAVAVPVSNRTFQFKHTDGLFVNTVIPRIKTVISLSVKENIANIAQQWLEVMNHSNYPLDKLASSIWKHNGQSLSSFCVAMFNLSRTSEAKIRIPSKHAKIPISIDVIKNELSDEVELILEWAEGLLPIDWVQRLFESLFSAINRPGLQLETLFQDISLISDSEKQLLESFNTSKEIIDVESVSCWSTFEQHVAEHGQKVAVICDGAKLTYEELNSKAYQIAASILLRIESHTLKHQPVVLLSNKNEDAIASILGIWKCGGYFLPISISNIGTLRDICERINPAMILTSLSEDEMPEIQIDCPVLNLKSIKEESKQITSFLNTDGDLAYVIRTSGSTGTPKQCKIRHKSLQTMAASWRKAYKLTDFDIKILQWAPLSFDVFIGDLVRALISVAGTLVICPDEKRLDVNYILKIMKEHKISLMEVTPQFGQQLVENAHKTDLESLQILVLGSDIVQTHLFKRLKSYLRAGQRLLNSYGMTEATIDSSFFEGEPPTTLSGTVPIGKPQPGVTFHIVNSETLKPCPVGTTGELFIEGDVLASGDVELVHLPFSKSFCLKTGDAVRWLLSGDVEHLGRLDNMMKLRGFRISSAEIEDKILCTNPEIRSVCVLPLTNDAGVEFLCVFVVLNGMKDGTLNKTKLCQRLRGELPYYMMPDIVHVIDQIPLTSNGKVNRNALPSIEHLLNAGRSVESKERYDDSSTASVLTHLFSEAMGVDYLAVDPDLTFMEQGGHSLILLRFASLIKMSTVYKIGIADIFSYPSISALSRFINEVDEKETSSTGLEEVTSNGEKYNTDDIAITGIGMRLPGGIESLPEFWRVLINGDDLINDFPNQRKEDFLRCVDANKLHNHTNVTAFQGAFLDSADQFDHQFFKIAPGEAKFMSPEQRLFLQVSTEALSEARNIAEVGGSKIGVFVANSEIGYAELNLPDDAVGISGLMPGMVATRVAYQWDLKGPTMLVDTACSSSLMALKLACESIKKGECEGALVGGVNVVMYPARTGVYGETGILSPNFHCNAFDRNAEGTAVGEGVICLFIEPLQNAMKNGTQIYGVLKGISSNSVGHGNGITAPTSKSQQSVIELALKQTGMRPSDISYIEAHGTGTKLGDRIELAALSAVFNQKTGVELLPIGAAKTVFGHLDSAAGMVGVLKVLAANVFKQIPPMHMFRNPHKELENSVLVIPSKPTSFNTDGSTFTAGISSFGLTGTNCHAIITESPVKRLLDDEDHKIPLLIFGKNVNKIKKQISYHITFIEETIVKNRINTIAGFCVTIAKLTNHLSAGKLGSNDLRAVIYVRNAHQALKVLCAIQNIDNEDELKTLSSVRNDVAFKKTTLSSAVDSFLTSGSVNLDELFEERDRHKYAVGVHLDIFDTTRHWCDPSTSVKREKEGLLEILQKKITDAREMVRSLPLAATSELKDLEGRFCVAVIIKLLLATKLSTAIKENKEVTLRKSFKDTGMLQKYDKLYYVMVRELFENNIIKATGKDTDIYYLDSFQFQCNHLLDIDPEPIARYAMDKYPAWSDCFRFPLYCSQYLTKVLWGKMSPLSVIYPQGDLNYMYKFDKLGDLIGDVYYNMYMQTIAEYAKQLSSQGKKVRVLEVGAGMGHVTRQLIPKLKDTQNVEYWFTDLGKAFVENAKTLFEDYLYMMKFSTFDITKSAPKQGLLGSYDIVISYNVIHTTESVMDSVTNLKSCVGDDGTLFVIESAKNETWATLAWGILDGWWYFKDYDLRPDEPMMEPEKWERVLKGAGFGSVHSCPVDSFEREQVEKFLFVCSAKPLSGELKREPGWWETIDLKTRRHQDLEEEVNRSTDTGVEDTVIDRTAIHNELKQIWCELLGLEDIKPTDDFNSLGGESLLAIQMMTLVRKRIGYQLEIADTFGYPTLGALADYLADRIQEEEDDAIEISEKWTISTPSSMSEIDEAEDGGTLLMFPGQGAQKAGMCLSMKDSLSAKELFRRAEKIIGYNVLDICVKNDVETTEKLKSTEFVQVALLVGCLAKVEQLKEDNPEILDSVSHVSGLSVGEFAALVYAEVITFEDAVKIIQIRGRAMENEVKRSATGMVSVFGPNCDDLDQFLKKHYPKMKISTYLADNQHTVAGTDEEVDGLVADLNGTFKEHLNIIDVRRLRVAGAFHSWYMTNASKLVDPVIESVLFSKPKIPLIMNVTGLIEEDPNVIKELVCKQLIAPVMWKQSVITAYEAGVTNFTEIAPSRVLSSIVKNRISRVKNCSSELIVV